MKRLLLLMILTFCVFSTPSISQTLLDDSNPPAKLRVFIDGCERWDGGCDMDFIRTEITAVDFYRDNEIADLFLLIVSNRSGGGGRQYQLLFVGQQNIHAGRNDTLYINTNRQIQTMKSGKNLLGISNWV